MKKESIFLISLIFYFNMIFQLFISLRLNVSFYIINSTDKNLVYNLIIFTQNTIINNKYTKKKSILQYTKFQEIISHAFISTHCCFQMQIPLISSFFHYWHRILKTKDKILLNYAVSSRCFTPIALKASQKHI